MDSGSWLPMYGDGWYATLAEFDTWEGGFDFSDAPTTFDEAAAARVSCTPLTDEERAAAKEVPLTCDDLLASERAASMSAQRPERVTADDAYMARLWAEYDGIIAAQRGRH